MSHKAELVISLKGEQMLLARKVTQERPAAFFDMLKEASLGGDTGLSKNEFEALRKVVVQQRFAKPKEANPNWLISEFVCSDKRSPYYGWRIFYRCTKLHLKGSK